MTNHRQLIQNSSNNLNIIQHTIILNYNQWLNQPSQSSTQRSNQFQLGYSWPTNTEILSFCMSYEHTKKTINGYSYYLTQRIGSGCSSQVYRGINDKTKEEVAIKVVNKVQQKGTQITQMAETQINCLQLFKGSQNILQLQHVIQSKNNIYIITELCKKGTLADILHKQTKIPQSKAICFISQIINGFKSITAQKLVHRDLKPMNILVTKTYDLKIGDFGLSIDGELCDQSQNKNVGTPLYMPLQALKSNKYSVKSDIWAIGIIFIELITGKNPWKSKTYNQLIKELQMFEEQDIIPINIGASSKEFLSGCLKKDKQKRFNVQQLLAFNFIQEREVQNQMEMSSLLKLKSTLSSNSQHTKSTSFLKVQMPTNRLAVGEAMYKSSNNLLQVFSNDNVRKISQRTSLKTCYNEKKYNQHSEQSTIHEECSIKVSQIDTKYIKQRQKDINSDSALLFPSMVDIQSYKLDKSFILQSSMNMSSKSDNDLEQNNKLDQINDKLNQQSDRKSKASTPANNHLLKVAKQQRNISQSFLSNSANQYSQINQKKDTTPTKQKLRPYQKQILLQVQGQINYFRFIYKLFKKLQDIIKTSDERIYLFKSNLLFIVYQKIEEIKSLKYVTQTNWEQRKQFENTPEYVNLLNVLETYKQRYKKQTEKDSMKSAASQEKDLIGLMTAVMNILYQNILMIQLNEDELNKKKALVFILQDLIHLKDIYTLQTEDDWHSFYLKSQIGTLISVSPPVKIDMGYWKKVKQRFLQLAH